MFLCVLIIIQNINTCLKIHCPCKRIAHICIIPNKNFHNHQKQYKQCLLQCLFEIEGGINLVSKRLNGLKYQIWPTNFTVFKSTKSCTIQNAENTQESTSSFQNLSSSWSVLLRHPCTQCSLLNKKTNKSIFNIIYTYTCDCMHNFSVQGRKSKCTTITSDREKC